MSELYWKLFNMGNKFLLCFRKSHYTDLCNTMECSFSLWSLAWSSPIEYFKLLWKLKSSRTMFFPEHNGKGTQLAFFSSTGPAGHFVLYDVSGGHITGIRNIHSSYHQFLTVCHYTFQCFAQPPRSGCCLLNSDLKNLWWSGKIWQHWLTWLLEHL